MKYDKGELVATRQAYGTALLEQGKRDNNIVALDADLAGSTRSIIFGEKFPERFFDVGVAEQNMMCIAAGLATTGKIPFASTFAAFATGRTYDQIRVGVAYSNLNVKIVGSHAGLMTGEDGASHQALEDINLMRGLPNMRVICPADAIETDSAVNEMAKYKGPVYLRLCRSATPVIYDNSYRFEFGKGSVVRNGNDIAIFAIGVGVSEALKAADQLKKENRLDAAVINMSSIKPFDEELVLKYAKSSRVILTVEDHSIIGGLGSAVAEAIAGKTEVKFARLGVQDVFGESGKPYDLLKKFGLDSKQIAAKAAELSKN